MLIICVAFAHGVIFNTYCVVGWNIFNVDQMRIEQPGNMTDTEQYMSFFYIEGTIETIILNNGMQ